MASRVILITGSNQGIGYELVRQLARQKHTVYLTARSAEKAKEAVAKLNGENITAKSLVLDVTSQESVDAAAKQFATEQGHLDVLVNNAGIASEAYNSDASKPDQDVIRKTFETNFFGVIRVCAAFTPFVRKSSNPVILNISSSLGSLSMQSDPKNEQSKIQLPGYNSSKSALNAYTISLASSLPEARVNMINPGYVSTNINNYSGTVKPEDSAAGVIKTGILLDKSGPTCSFLNYTGDTLPW